MRSGSLGGCYSAQVVCEFRSPAVPFAEQRGSLASPLSMLSDITRPSSSRPFSSRPLPLLRCGRSRSLRQSMFPLMPLWHLSSLRFVQEPHAAGPLFPPRHLTATGSGAALVCASRSGSPIAAPARSLCSGQELHAATPLIVAYPLRRPAPPLAAAALLRSAGSPVLSFRYRNQLRFCPVSGPGFRSRPRVLFASLQITGPVAGLC